MCFTWTLKNDDLRLKCKVNWLRYDISIFDRNGIEQGSCNFPLFKPVCYNYHPNGYIFQDFLTNTTTLTIRNAGIESSFNGNWTCRHGRGIDIATAEVTYTIPIKDGM